MASTLKLPGISIYKAYTTFNDTYTSLKRILNDNPNIKITAEVNHQNNAINVDLILNPTRVIIFGNPNLGTPLMQKNQLTGLDLPQKILIYENDKKEVNLSFNNIDYLIERHQLNEISTLNKIAKALDTIVTSAGGNKVVGLENDKINSDFFIINKNSKKSFEETYSGLKELIEKNSNLKIITEVDHQQNASNNGLPLRPTKLIIFGNPKLGTPLMQSKVTTALDLPQKVLIWVDKSNKVTISYNNPDLFISRHEIDENDLYLNKIKAALDKITDVAGGIE